LLEIAKSAAPSDAADECLKALGLSRGRGKGSPFEEFRLWEKRAHACESFARRILEGEAYKNARLDTAKECKISGETLDVWLRDFFPAKQGDETWLDFFRRKTALEGPDFDKTLCAFLGFVTTVV
jgi:hypothetical protein